MFEKEIKFISDFSLNRIKKLGAYFTTEQLKKTDLHPAILQYISSELDYKIYEDRKRLLQDSFFDYSGNEISNYFNLISDEIKKNKMLAYEDVKRLILHAVTFTSNFLARPSWALTKIIFEDQTEKPIDEIKYILRYPYYYEHIIKVITAYLDKKQVAVLSLNEFETMLGKVDEQLLSSQSKQILDNVLFSMGDFFGIGELNRTKVPVKGLELYLKEKLLNELSLRLKKSLPLKPKAKYDLEELRKILHSKTPVEKQFILEPADKDEETVETIEIKEIAEEMIVPELDSEDELFEVEEEIVPEEFTEKIEELDEPEIDDENEEVVETETEEIKFDEEETEELPEEIKEEVKEESNELSESEIEDLFNFVEDIEIKKKEVIEEPVEEETKISKDVEKKYTDELVFEEEKPAEVSEEIFDVEADEIKPSSDSEINEASEVEDEEIIIDDDLPAVEEKPKKKIYREKDISEYMSEKESARIIAGVFNEDSEDFVNTLEKIAECENYEQATEILKGVFASYKVNIYSKESVLFTNIVSNYFDQE